VLIRLFREDLIDNTTLIVRGNLVDLDQLGATPPSRTEPTRTVNFNRQSLHKYQPDPIDRSPPSGATVSIFPHCG
jgi:hypothetical protein